MYLVFTVENSTLNRDSTFNSTVCLIESTEYLALSSMLTRSESPSDSEMKLPFQRSMDFFCANIKLTLCLDELSIIDYTY